jgi:nucleotide-binding universal stress UspA family protein
MSTTTTADRAVVVGVDGSPTAALAVAWAAEAARARGATLRLVAAHGDDSVGVARAQAVNQLNAAAAQARRLVPDVVIETEDVTGPPTTVLSRESADALAIVVGSRRLGPVHRVFTTSVGRTLAHTASCPVVVVRESPSRTLVDTRVVVGVAGPESTDEVQLAFAEASRLGAGLTAVHVLSTGSRDPLDGHRMLLSVLRPLRTAYPDVDVRRYVVGGSVAERMVTMSENARLLVLGSGKPGAWSALGPVSREVLRRSHCPVAVVPAPAPEPGSASGPAAHLPLDPEKKVMT